jgi:sugar O-acyltransferase (sialic acid O-acetyltransferase NeuD family)
MKKLVIFPYNGNGLEAIDCINNEFEFLGFIDDTPEKQGINKYGHTVYDRSFLINNPDVLILAVPGSPTSYKNRHIIIAGLGIEDNRFATIIHPNAQISGLATIGKNVLIMAGVVITSNAVINNHVCILPNTVIHHDSLVGSYSLLGSNISVAGSVQIGDNCYIGSGSRIINNIKVGHRCLIGMGSNVLKSIPDESKVVGNPARQI